MRARVAIRSLASLYLLVGATVLLTAAAAPSPCSYDSNLVSIYTGDTDLRVAVAENDAIVVSNGTVTVSCGEATVYNTDQINVYVKGGEVTFTIDQTAGAFEPGAMTTEPLGAPEIEFEVDGGEPGATLRVLGTSFEDSIVLRDDTSYDDVNLYDTGIDLNGDGDSDIVGYDLGSYQIFGGEGGDTVDGTGSSIGIKSFYGGLGNDTLAGSPGNDALFGDSGADSLQGGPGNDSMDGGSGIDTADFSVSAAGVIVRLADGSATGDGVDEVVNVEEAIGTQYDDQIFGNELVNHLSGGAGDDLLDAELGVDAYDGGEGTDTCVPDDVADEPRVGCELPRIEFSDELPDLVPSVVHDQIVNGTLVLTVRVSNEGPAAVEQTLVKGTAPWAKGQVVEKTINQLGPGVERLVELEFAIPEDVSGGMHEFTVTVDPANVVTEEDENNATDYVVRIPEEVPEPSIELQPPTTGAGEHITVVGSGWNARAGGVRIYVNPADPLTERPNQTAKPKADGTFTVDLLIPELDAGAYPVLACQRCGRPDGPDDGATLTVEGGAPIWPWVVGATAALIGAIAAIAKAWKPKPLLLGNEVKAELNIGEPEVELDAPDGPSPVLRLTTHHDPGKQRLEEMIRS